MSVFEEDNNSAREILYLNYNQTSTSLSVGTKTGYMIYDFDQVTECSPTYESRGISDVCIIEKNFSSSLIAYVSLDSPRRLVLYNYTKGTDIYVKHFPNTVLSVKLNRKNVVVCLEDTIYIFYFLDVNEKRKHLITNIPSNVKGIIAMTHGNGNTMIAYPSSPVNGDVQIFDATGMHAKTTIPAHSSQLAALALDEDGTKLASASIKGTVIRVYSVVKSTILFEFRRGVKRCVEIHSLAFDRAAEFVCCSSNTETIHIFKLCTSQPTEQVEEENESWGGTIGRVLMQSVKFLPTQMSDVLTQQRAFATVHLPFVDQKTVCAVSKIQNVHYVMVASLEGFLYIYELNTEVGGPCQLIKQHRLEGPFEPVAKVVKPSVENQSLISHKSASAEDTLLDIPQLNAVIAEETQSEASDTSERNGITFTNDELPPLLNEVEHH